MYDSVSGHFHTFGVCRNLACFWLILAYMNMAIALGSAQKQFVRDRLNEVVLACLKNSRAVHLCGESNSTQRTNEPGCMAIYNG